MLTDNRLCAIDHMADKNLNEWSVTRQQVHEQDICGFETWTYQAETDTVPQYQEVDHDQGPLWGWVVLGGYCGHEEGEEGPITRDDSLSCTTMHNLLGAPFVAVSGNVGVPVIVITSIHILLLLYIITAMPC